jgi:superfamily II DNA/RNA helicase
MSEFVSSRTGPFIIDNSGDDRKVVHHLRDWCLPNVRLDIATGTFEIGGLLAIADHWPKTSAIRILMGADVSLRTKSAFERALGEITRKLDQSIEDQKRKDDFLDGVDAIVSALRAGKIACRVYTRDKFHAKAYIVRDDARALAMAGSSNFTVPGLTENVELNTAHAGADAAALAAWFDQHWDQAQDVTLDILQTVERHVQLFSPFDVYAKSLQELFLGYEATATEWEKGNATKPSKMYPILDQYQRDGYHQLLKISERFRGAFLCDGVGLGKTFMGLMLIERLVIHDRKNVCLLVPKAARKPVWEAALARYLPDLGGVFGSRLRIYNHTDLIRNATSERNFPQEFIDIAAEADVFIIDEAHHFRNPGIAGEGERQKSRYRRLSDICGGKQMFLLTATPVNNRLIDLQHMIELFSRKEPDYIYKCDPTLGIHSLPGHFRKMEKDLEQMVMANHQSSDEPVETNAAEAERVLSDDRLFRKLVVQRSRSYVKRSQEKQGGSQAIFPTREAPHVGEYKLKKTYGKLLDMVDAAFKRKKALFALAIYSPESYPAAGAAAVSASSDEPFPGATKGRQEQIVGLIRTSFLKRFESSAEAFKRSCHALLLKLLAFAEVHSDEPDERRHLDRFKARHAELVGRVERELSLFDDPDAAEQDDLVPPEMLEEAQAAKLDRTKYNVPVMLAETLDDLNQVADFLKELDRFEPAHDDKLKALIKLLKTDPVLKKHKVLIFTEFMDTARYLQQQLSAAGIEGVDEIDSAVKRDRGEMIKQFSPYYNGSSSKDLEAQGLPETRVLISTDVLSEGLNLQDATRMINYDLHWNPVRLMQRIGRVDRRLNPQVEQALLADHPDQKDIRGNVAYWNFLPPDELNDLLTLYSRVTHKTLRISKTFGIEGKKLLTPQDDFDALKDFTEEYEGTLSPIEQLHLEYQDLLNAHPSLEAKLDAMPGRVFSGKAHPTAGAKGVFFCYARPGPPANITDARTGDALLWTEATGDVRWYLYDLTTTQITDDPAAIAGIIRSTPQTKRETEIAHETLGEVRGKVEKHIKNTYLKAAQAPVGVKPVLRAWMELN